MTTLLQTPRTKSPEKSVVLGISTTCVMSDHLIYSPNLLLDGGLSAKTRNWVGGKAFSGMITTLFHGHPEQYLHTLALACTHHAPLQQQTLLRQGLSFKGVCEPLPHTAGIFVVMFLRCCASGFGSVKTFLAAPAFCTVFTAFSYSRFFPVEFATPAAVAVLGPKPLQLHRL